MSRRLLVPRVDRHLAGGMEENGEESPAAGETNLSVTDGLCPRDSEAMSIPAEPDSFDCCICLDLIYKPVVLACGHTACFWCVHYAMHGFFESKCPICRKQYKHFPAICQLLHNLLRKLKPAEYKQREEEVLDMERETDCFSPQFIEDDTDAPSTQDGPSLEHSSSISGINENPAQESKTTQRIPPQVPISDLLCAGCSEFLFRPAVLNCGHAYCELCMAGLRKENLRCQVCGNLHPGHPPLICLSLNSFLENQFPIQFAARTALLQPSVPSAAAVEAEEDVGSPRAAASTIMIIHYGVGCDYCGMYPILGSRYRCTDCKERMGFDLCEGCFEARSDLPPRFNQRHTPDHSFVPDESKALRIEMAHPSPGETRQMGS